MSRNFHRRDELPVELLFLHLSGDCGFFGFQTQYVPGVIPSSSSASEDDEEPKSRSSLKSLLRGRRNGPNGLQSVSAVELTAIV
ncbi:hypothetical protein HanRHA438_Chr09g0422701 [Helianthus annuus]|nr:hypothetical protein HanRHA438_Chr09g0422701 [Helianthus annuus]